MNADLGLNASTLVKMEEALAAGATIPARATDAWCDMRQHVVWGAVFRAALIAGWQSYPGYITHRTPEPNGEFSPIYLRRLLSMPLRRLKRRFATAHIRRTTFPFHVIHCSLADRANFRKKFKLRKSGRFLDLILAGFAKGASPSSPRRKGASTGRWSREPATTGAEACQTARHGTPHTLVDLW